MEEFLLKHFPTYAPFILIAAITFLQYKIFSTPADLEKLHREIVEKMEERFVTFTVFNTVIEGLKQQIGNVDKNVEKLCDIFVDGGKR